MLITSCLYFIFVYTSLKTKIQALNKKNKTKLSSYNSCVLRFGVSKIVSKVLGSFMFLTSPCWCVKLLDFLDTLEIHERKNCTSLIITLSICLVSSPFGLVVTKRRWQSWVRVQCPIPSFAESTFIQFAFHNWVPFTQTGLVASDLEPEAVSFPP